MRMRTERARMLMAGLTVRLLAALAGQGAMAKTKPAIQPILLVCENKAKKDEEVIPRYTAIMLNGPFEALVANPISPDALENFRPAEVTEHSSKRIRFTWTQLANIKTRGFAGEMPVTYKFTIDKTNNTFRVTATGAVLFIPGNGHGRCVGVKPKKT